MTNSSSLKQKIILQLSQILPTFKKFPLTIIFSLIFTVCAITLFENVQFIDDDTEKTLTATSTLSPEFKKGGAKVTVEGAGTLGSIAADKAKAAGISTVVFDRGGFSFHGKIKALADSARKNGLNF